jgi:hypothetical protein
MARSSTRPSRLPEDSLRRRLCWEYAVALNGAGRSADALCPARFGAQSRGPGVE